MVTHTAQTGSSPNILVSPRTAPAPHVSRRDVALHGARRLAYESNDPVRVAAQRKADLARIRVASHRDVLCGNNLTARKPGDPCAQCGTPIGWSGMHYRRPTAIEQAETVTRMTSDLQRAFPAFGEAQ